MAHVLTAVPGIRENSLFYHSNDGFLYHKYQHFRGTDYYRCSVDVCNARGLMRLGQEFQARYSHCHGPSFQHVEYLRQRRMLVSAASSQDSVHPRDIVNEFRNSNPEFEHLLTYDRLRPALNRARLAMYPPEPVTLVLLDDILRNPLFKSLCGVTNAADSLYAGSIQSEDGCKIILLMTRRCCEVIKWAPLLYAFSVTIPIRGSNDNFEFHTIGTIVNHTSIPLAYLLLETSTLQAYISGFSILRDYMIQWHFKNVICDEGPAAEAYSHVFSVNVDFILDHFISDIKRLSNAIIPEEVMDQHTTVNILEMFCGLPMVPQELLPDAIAVLRMELVRENELAQHVLSLILINIEMQWLRSPLKGPTFSVCGNHARTSNALEITEQRLKQILIPHGDTGFYAFIANIRRIEETSFQDYIKLSQGETPGTRRVSSLSEDDEIIVLTRTLNQLPGSLSASLTNLMWTASKKKQHVFHNA